MAKFWQLHHYNQCMGENRRKTLTPGGVYASVFGYDAYDASNPNTEACMCVCFVALIIQGVVCIIL